MIQAERVAPDLRSWLVHAQPDWQAHVIVEVRPRSKVLQVAARSLPVEHCYERLPAFCARLAVRELLALLKDPGVLRVYRDVEVRVNGISIPFLTRPPAVALAEVADIIGAREAWEAGLKGRDIRAAVIDTGVDAEHMTLRGRVVGQADFTGEGKGDSHGHGTMVAGCIAGCHERYAGIAPEAIILDAKVLDRRGAGLMSDVMAGVEWAADERAQVINLSLGVNGPTDGRDPLSRLCDVVASQGIVVIAAAGNGGPRARSVGSPAGARDVIAVGATHKDDSLARFSARGPTADGRPKPELCAPGVDIIGPRAHGTSMGHPVDEWFTRASGTSFAAPIVAGCVALLLQVQPELSPKDVLKRLTAGCEDLHLDRNAQGAGRVNIARSLGLGEEERRKPPEAAKVPGCLGCVAGCSGLAATAGLALLALLGWRYYRRR